MYLFPYPSPLFHSQYPYIFFIYNLSSNQVNNIFNSDEQETSKFEDNFINIVDIQPELIAKMTTTAREVFSPAKKQKAIIDLATNVYKHEDVSQIADVVLGYFTRMLEYLK